MRPRKKYRVPTVPKVTARTIGKANALYFRNYTLVHITKQVFGLEHLRLGDKSIGQGQHDLAGARSGRTATEGATAVRAVAFDQSAHVKLEHNAPLHNAAALPGLRPYARLLPLASKPFPIAL